MCGIIGRIGNSSNMDLIINGLKMLEYRGYDSFGLLYSKCNLDSMTINNNILKDVGSISDVDVSKFLKIDSNIEIGHTRWATHGSVNIENAHPHFDLDEKFFVVSNGIVENYLDIKNFLLKNNYKFKSDTDSEVIPNLFDFYFNNLNYEIEKFEKFSLKKKILIVAKKVVLDLEGDFSFLLKFENHVLAYKNQNPIVIGIDLNEIFISSDFSLVENTSSKYFFMEDNHFFLVSYLEKISYNYFNFNLKNVDFNLIKSKNILNKNLVENLNDDFNIEIKNNLNTNFFMEKEIFESKLLNNFLDSHNINSINYLISILKKKELILLGAGTSYNAAMYFHYKLLELGILSRVILASELNNYLDVLNNKLLVVFSQSGETADLIHPLKILQDKNEIFSIINSKNSTLDRFAKNSIYLNCGKEIGVASTKAFIFDMFFVKVFEAIYLNKYDVLLDELKDFKSNFNDILKENSKTILDLVNKFNNINSLFYIGRNKYYPLSVEGALKLKEISYIHVEGFAGGELKHGTLALIEDGIPVMVLGSESEIISNAIEIKTRGGIIVGIGSKNNEIYDYFLKVPKSFDDIFITILLQVFAFNMSLKLGFNPDKPRNLAKSVTVK